MLNSKRSQQPGLNAVQRWARWGTSHQARSWRRPSASDEREVLGTTFRASSLSAQPAKTIYCIPVWCGESFRYVGYYICSWDKMNNLKKTVGSSRKYRVIRLHFQYKVKIEEPVAEQGSENSIRRFQSLVDPASSSEKGYCDSICCHPIIEMSECYTKK